MVLETPIEADACSACRVRSSMRPPPFLARISRSYFSRTAGDEMRSRIVTKKAWSLKKTAVFEMLYSSSSALLSGRWLPAELRKLSSESSSEFGEPSGTKSGDAAEAVVDAAGAAASAAAAVASGAGPMAMRSARAMAFASLMRLELVDERGVEAVFGMSSAGDAQVPAAMRPSR